MSPKLLGLGKSRSFWAVFRPVWAIVYTSQAAVTFIVEEYTISSF